MNYASRAHTRRSILKFFFFSVKNSPRIDFFLLCKMYVGDLGNAMFMDKFNDDKKKILQCVGIYLFSVGQ